MENFLLEKQMEVQLDLISQKLMNEIKSLKDEVKGMRDDISSINKNLKNASFGGPITSSPPSRQDFQVNPPNVAPSSQDPYGGYGNEGYPRGYPQPVAQQQFQQQFQQPQQFAQPRYQQPAPVQIDQNQGGFTGASIAESTRGKGTSLPPNLAMDKVFYCGGKR